jgi:hypothetical protein
MHPDEPAGRSPEPEVAPPPPQPPEVMPPSELPPPPTGYDPAWTAPDTTPTTDGWAPPASATGQPSTSGRRPKAIVVGAIAFIAALAVAIGLKVAPFLAAGVLGSALAGAFGGPWDRLPADVQNGFEQRLEAAVGDSLEGLGGAERNRRLGTLILSGLPRLSDDQLVRRLVLQTGALRSANESLCAAYGRQAVTGKAVDEAISIALISSLSTDEVVEWIGINIEAIEAEMQASPEQVFASEEEASAVLDTIIGSMSEVDVQAMADMSRGTTTDDAHVCSAVRSLYGAVASLDPWSQAVMARIDIQQ